MPPDPKHQSARARRNKHSTRATLQQTDIDDIDIPPMPAFYEKFYDAEAQDWRKRQVPYEIQAIIAWETWWKSPMRGEWTQADYIGLCRLIILENRFWRGEGDHSEIRLSQKDYGLTPLDRRRLEWSIESSEKAKDEGAKRRSRTSPMPNVETSDAPQSSGDGSDPRLYAIEGGLAQKPAPQESPPPKPIDTEPDPDLGF